MFCSALITLFMGKYGMILNMVLSNTRALPLMCILAINWLLWVWAIGFNIEYLGISIILSEIIAFVSYIHVSRIFSRPAQAPFILTGIGILILALGEFVLMLYRLGVPNTLIAQDVLSIVGALCVFAGAFRFPYIMQELGFYPKAATLQAIKLSVLSGVLFAVLLALAFPKQSIIIFYSSITFAVFFLSSYQIIVLKSLAKFKLVIYFAVGLAFLMIARMISLFSILYPGDWDIVYYSLIWMIGMQAPAVSLAMSTQNNTSNPTLF